MDDIYGRLLREPTDVQAHLPRFVELARGLGARRVIELGVRQGVSTVAWIKALEETGGTVWAVDPGAPPFEHRRMKFVQGWSTSLDVLEILPAEADVVFIDTDHTFELTLEELRLYAPRVAPGGALVLHDTAVEQFPHHYHEDYRAQPPYPVRAAIEAWLGELGAVGELPVIDWYHDSYGLAVIWPDAVWVGTPPVGNHHPMRIELTIAGLAPERARDIPNLRVYDTRNGKAVFEFGAGDAEPPRDYGSAHVRARDAVEARGGQVIEFRPLDDSSVPVNLEDAPEGEVLIITPEEDQEAHGDAAENRATEIAERERTASGDEGKAEGTKATAGRRKK